MAKQTFTSGQVLTAAQMTSLQANDYNWTVSEKTADYVLVATDAGTRVAMNSASAQTITVNTGLFSAGDTLFVQNIGAGTCTITAGTATVTTSGSLALAQWGGGTLYFTSASAAVFFSGGGDPTYGTATGGTSLTPWSIGADNYNGMQFTSSSTLTVTKSGLFDFLICAAGGGGGRSSAANYACGGGGGGRYLITEVYLSVDQTVTIGSGGAGSTVNGVNGSRGGNSIIGDYATVGGGGGSSIYTSAGAGSATGKQLDGGSGGGGTFTLGEFGLAVIASQGNSVQAGYNAGGAGYGSTNSGTTGGSGDDVSAFIGGSTLYKCAGGGSGLGVGGSGVGGNAATSAAANTASGGGGAPNTNAGSGGSGIVYVRFKV